MTTLIIPHYMVVDLKLDAWHGASLSCGIFFLWGQFVKIGFRMKVHWFMTSKLLLYSVSYNLHKFKIHIIESDKYYEVICIS